MSGLPPSRQVNANDTEFVGVPGPPAGPIHNVDFYQFVTASYLSTMGIPVVEGRGFLESDFGGGGVVLINESTARKFYPERSPIGRVLKPSLAKEPSLTIVGVVKDVKQRGVGEETGTEIYLLYEQLPALVDVAPGAMNVVVRSATPFETIAPTLTQIVRAMDPRLPVVGMQPMHEVFAESIARPRFLLQLLAAFAGLALLLAAVGTVRRPFIPGERAASGDRHPHGARRRAPRVDRYGHGTWSDSRGCRTDAGAGWRVCDNEIDADAVVQRAPRRSAHV